MNGTIFISCLLFYGLAFGIPNSFGGSKPRSSNALFAIPNPIPGVGAPRDLRACYLDPSPPRPPWDDLPLVAGLVPGADSTYYVYGSSYRGSKVFYALSNPIVFKLLIPANSDIFYGEKLNPILLSTIPIGYCFVDFGAYIYSYHDCYSIESHS